MCRHASTSRSLFLIPAVILTISLAAWGDPNTISVSIDPGRSFQTITGFGHGNMEQRTPLWYRTYGPEGAERICDTLYTLKDGGLGLTIYRYPMPANDAPDHDHMNRLTPHSNKPFEYAPGKFQWDGHDDVLWMGSGAVKRGARLWASWYGFPYWLSVSGCAAGSEDGRSNNLIEGKEVRFVRHIISVLTHFRDAWGLTFDWVGPINEPEADWWKTGGGQPGSHVSPEQAIVIYRALDKALQKHDFEVKLTAYDAAFTNTTAYLDTLLASDIKPAIDVLTCHQYVTSREGLEQWARRAEQFNKELWMSEWGDWNNAGSKEGMQTEQMMNYASKLHEAFDVLQASAWIMWEAGFLFNDGPEALEKRKSYWAVAHYSRHIRPGARRVGCQSRKPALTTAFQNAPDDSGKSGSLVIVTVNSEHGDLDVHYTLESGNTFRIVQARRTSQQEDYAVCEDVRLEDGLLTAALGPQSILTIELERTP